jgi:YHS domain-containing protein
MTSKFIHISAVAAAFFSLGALTATGAFAVVPTSASAVDADEHGIAMQGYDPVAYFTEGAPHKGDARFKLTQNGATYYFANSANMKRFKKNPVAYLPQFGGFCAMGTAMSQKFEGDPKVWHIVDNKLYLNFNPDVDRRWGDAVPSNITKANENWPGIKFKTPDELSKQ